MKFEVSPALLTVGVYGTGIFLSMSNFQFMLSKKRWFFTSWAPGSAELTSLQVPVSLRQVGHEQMLDERLGIFVETLGEDDLAFQDLLVDGHWVVVVERIDARDHFV